MYCIYTDRDVPIEEGSWDHIFPLALGGNDKFAVWSDSQSNSVIGSEVDGALSRDPLLAFALRDSGVRGHRRSSVEPRWRKVTMDGRPMQISWGRESIRAWDARERRELEDGEFVGQKMNAKFNISLDLPLRFVARAALAGGYFLYGPNFKQTVDCDELRSLVFLDIEKLRRDGTLDDCNIKFCDRFHQDSISPSANGLIRMLCECISRSLFIATPHDDSISFHVGVVGQFLGSMIVPAKTDQLPNDKEHDLGHAIVLGPGDMQRLSFRALIQDFRRAVAEAS